MRFLGRWLSDALSTAAALAMAILAMQAPAFTHEYVSALGQLVQDERRDIDQRKASARQFYAIPATDDEAVVAALKPHEPSNAATLAQAVDHADALQRAKDRIAGAPALLRPVVAFADAFNDRGGVKAPVWRNLLATYSPQLSFRADAALYALAGLLAGSLLAHLLLAAGRGLTSGRAPGLRPGARL